ncbi:MAG TPA: hypothetical protein VMM27_08430 [Casimicrobiaceae bacterium]|nr:hypothetical protein [Casimicrobiaceae bacterium]
MKSADRRAVRRIAVAPSSEIAPAKLENVSLQAKVFLPASKTESDGVVTELSPDGATVQLRAHLDVSTDLVLYVEGFDRFSSSVVRVGQDHVRVRFHGSLLKRDRTAARIEAHLKGEAVPQARQAPSNGIGSHRTFVRQNGATAEFEVIDISLLGAALKSRCRPPIGEVITIGTTESRVARYLDGGFAVEFIRPQAQGFAEAPEPQVL